MPWNVCIHRDFLGILDQGYCVGWRMLIPKRADGWVVHSCVVSPGNTGVEENREWFLLLAVSRSWAFGLSTHDESFQELEQVIGGWSECKK